MGGGFSAERKRVHAAVALHNRKVQAQQAQLALEAYSQSGVAPLPIAEHISAPDLAGQSGQEGALLAKSVKPEPRAGPCAVARQKDSLPSDYFRKKLEGRRLCKQGNLATGAAKQDSTVEGPESRPSTAPPRLSRPQNFEFIRVKPLSTLSTMLHGPEHNELDEYWTNQSNQAWKDVNEVSSVMAAKLKARDDRLAKIRAEELRRKRIAQEKHAEMERLRLEQLRGQAQDDEETKGWEKRNAEQDAVHQEHRLQRKEEVRIALEELMLSEFNTEEEFYESLAEYVDILRMVEEEEESLAKKRREGYYDDAGNAVPKDLQAFLPGYMSDLVDSQTSRHRSKVIGVGKIRRELSSEDSEDERNPRRVRRRRRRRKGEEISNDAMEEAELEVLLDRAVEKGFAEVARVLGAHAKMIALSRGRQLQRLREEISRKIKRLPGYYTFFRPLKKQLQASYKGAKEVVYEAFSPQLEAAKLAVADMKRRIRAIRYMEMHEDWRAQNHELEHASEQLGYGLQVRQRIEDLHLVERKTITTRHHQMMEEEFAKRTGVDCQTSGPVKDPTRSKSRILHAVGRMEQLMAKKECAHAAENGDDHPSDGYDVYGNAASVGAILPCEGDKRGMYFGELELVLDTHQRHGHGVLQEPRGRTFVGQWVHNVLHGFALEIRSDGAYCIGLFDRGEVSQLGWQRPQKGGMYGYCGMFLHGKPHGYGFRVLLSQVRSRDNMRTEAYRRESEGKDSGEVEEEDGAEGEAAMLSTRQREAGLASLSAMLSFERGTMVEQIDLPEIEMDGFKNRIGKFLRLAFAAVKEAGEYTDMDQPWLNDGEQLLYLLMGYPVALVESSTSLTTDDDFAYLKKVSEVHSRPESAGPPGNARACPHNGAVTPPPSEAEIKPEVSSTGRAVPAEDSASDVGRDERGKRTQQNSKVSQNWTGDLLCSASLTEQGRSTPIAWDQSSIYTRPSGANVRDADAVLAPHFGNREGEGRLRVQQPYTRPSSGVQRKVGKLS